MGEVSSLQVYEENVKMRKCENVKMWKRFPLPPSGGRAGDRGCRLFEGEEGEKIA